MGRLRDRDGRHGRQYRRRLRGIGQRRPAPVAGRREHGHGGPEGGDEPGDGQRIVTESFEDDASGPTDATTHRPSLLTGEI